ncbi:MAG: class I SAM-dependent methyltransferase [Oscillospiraceae bacterium]|nr:class I SAM-dependent methyltransferase [Oscillospiraceae bacterium]
MDNNRYYNRLAAAYVRGHALKKGFPGLPDPLLSEPLDSLSDAEFSEIIESGRQAELKLYRFKTTHSDMPRIRKVMGFLKSVSFESLLDVGSGRGVFLMPFMTEFPWVKVTSADILPHRVEFLNEISLGGIENLNAIEANICEQPLEEDSVDIVTMLEVLEHIPNTEAAVSSAIKMAKKYIVLSVPSKPDDNPEHIHLFTKESLTDYFIGAGCKKVSFDGVDGHIIMIATVK